MSEQEQIILNNIANKVDLILYKNKITPHGLSKLIKIDKQLLYRITDREHMPSLQFLEPIATFLNCTILELMYSNYFLDIRAYYNYNVNNPDKHKKFRIYINDETFMGIIDNEFFGIIDNSFIKVFYKIDKVSRDGYYLIHQNSNTLNEINIISVGENLIIALIDNKETRLSHDQLKIVAKLYKIVSIIQSKEYAVNY